MLTVATELIEEAGTIIGVRAQGPDGPFDIRADLVVGADGRHSTIRQHAGLAVDDLGAPMDVLWMRLPRRPEDSAETFGRIEPGRMFVMLNRGDYWQCAMVIPKGGYEDILRRGFDAFRELVAEAARLPSSRTAELRSWDDVKLLTVTVERLRQWTARTAMHRRCRPRDVADRRRWYQPRRSGRRRGGQHPGQAPGGPPGRGLRPSGSADAARLSHQGDAMAAAYDPEPADQRDPEEHRQAPAALARQASRQMPDPAAHSSQTCRRRRASRARPNTGMLVDRRTDFKTMIKSLLTPCISCMCAAQHM